MLFDKLVAIFPLTRINPDSTEITEPIAQATLGSFQVLWHPAILSRSATAPVWMFASDPPVPAPGQLIVIPEPSRALLPYGWEERAASAGARVVVGGDTRASLLERVLESLPQEIGKTANHVEAAGFFAVGLARLFLEMLTAYMHHVSALDEQHLQKEILAAATAAVVGDRATQEDHLRATFHILAEARERLYGAEIYLLDLCLLDPNARLNRLGTQLESQLPLNVFASGRTIERLAQQNAPAAEQLRKLVDESRADIIGGEYDEVASTLLPLESHLWQFDRASKGYRAVLGRQPAVFGRRRFGLARHLLQILNRLEYLYVAHFCFDGGQFPHKTDPKVRWEAPDSSTMESLTRIPFAADSACEFLRFPARLARTIASDFVATLAFAHWPMPDVPWYADLLYMSRLANVFGKFSTLSHYFQSTDTPAISSALSNDDYASPFLEYDHDRGAPNPVGAYPKHHRVRARIDQIHWLTAITRLLGNRPTANLASLEELESSVEHGTFVDNDIDRAEREAVELLADLVCPTPHEVGTAGNLVFNPLSFERRVAVPIASPLAADGQPSYMACVPVPAMGFAWVSGSASADVSDTRATALVDDHTIRNQYLEVEIDPISGGIKSLRDHTVRVPQLGQQLLLVGCNNGGKSDDESPGPIRSSMRARSTSVVSAGPEYAGLAVEGELVADPCPSWTADPVVGRFRQTYWLGRNESVLRLVIEILEIDCDVFEGRASPWQCYLANRIAWPDSRSVLVRGVGTLSEVTRSQRPESPYFVEVHGRRNRVALITGGLPFHQRTGPRMLDTLLVTATEQCRRFELGFGIDLPNPFQAALDLITPAVMIARDGPPAVGAASWFVHLDVRNVVITSTTELGSDRSGIRLRLFESAGRYTRGRLRCFRNVAEARLTDFRGQRLATLDVQGDTVHLDLAPREITQLEVEFAVV